MPTNEECGLEERNYVIKDGFDIIRRWRGALEGRHLEERIECALSNTERTDWAVSDGESEVGYV